MLFEILVIAALIVLNAFFALSEFAIVSSNKYILKKPEQEKKELESL
jgi:CBS domain containing-hemolysin-like protein